MSNRFTQYILGAMVLGIIMGTLIFNYLPDSRGELAADINLIAMLFLRLIKMIIAPLVFATLVGGIAHMGSGAKLGRIFAKTMGWFVSASFVSLLLGLVMVNLLQPGDNFPGTLPDKAQSTGLPVSAFSIEKFLTHLIPTSIADAMAQNEILQIVVFAVFFSVALGAMPERSKQIISVIDDLAHIMLKVTSYVMLFAPIAVWAAITATVAKNGLLVLWKLVVFMGGFYLSLLLLWGILHRRLHRHRTEIQSPAAADPRTPDDRVLDRKLGSRISEDAGGPEPFRRVRADFELRAAARLFLQSRRHDDVLHFCQHLHRADIPDTNVARHPARDAGNPDDHLEGRRRRSPRFAGGDCIHAQPVRHSRGRAADDHGHRYLPRHGPQRHQCDRQHAGDLGGGEVGRRTWARTRAQPRGCGAAGHGSGRSPRDGSLMGAVHAPDAGKIDRGVRPIACGLRDSDVRRRSKRRRGA